MKNNYMQKILANRGVIAYFIALTMLCVALLVAFDFALEAHANAETTERKIQMMRQATEAYDKKKALLDMAPAKPVTSDKLDEVQTNILFQLQRNHLNLSNMNFVTSNDQKEKNQTFEMNISGSYDNTMAFLSSFKKDAKGLISILSVFFHPEKDELRTTIKYKIYVR